MSAGFVAVPVVPTFKGMSKEFAQRLEKPAKASGERAGKAMSEGMESAVENLERQVKASSSKLQDLDRAYEKSASKQAAQKEKVEAATLKLQDAEEKYQSALESGDKGLAELAKVKEAKARVIGETEKLEQAEIDVRVAEQKHQDQLDDLNSTLAKLQDSQSDLNRELEKSGGAFGSAKDRIQSMADSAKNGAAKFGEFAQKYKFHASAALGGIGLIAKQSMEYAAEAEQSYGAVESIFADHAQGIIDSSKRAATEVGVSGREYRELSASMGAMLKNMGMPMDEVADKSENLVGVAADLAATFGGSTKEAVEAVSSLLRGETDPIERYGVSIKQADINARMAADGLDGLTGEAEKQAKAQTLLKLLTEQTASAQGQFARETDTAAHKQQVATAKYNDAKEAIGTALLPLMAEFADKAANVAKVVGEHPKIFIAVAGAVATLSAAVVGAAVIAPIFTAWSAAATAAGTSMMGLAAATWTAIAPIAAVVAAVAAVGAALWAFFTKTETGREMWDKFTSALVEGWDWVVEKLSSGWTWLMENVFQPMSSFFMETLWPAIQSVLGFVGDAFSAIWDGLSWAWENVIQPVFNGILELAQITLGVIAAVILTPLLIAWNLLSTAIQWAWENVIQPVWQALSDFAMNALWPALQSVFQWIGDAWQWLSDKFSAVWGWIRDNVLSPMVGFFQNTLWPAIQDVLGWIGDKWQWMSDTLSTIVNWIYDNVIMFYVDALKSLWDNVQQVISWIADKWQWMSDMLSDVWNWIYQNVILRAIDGYKNLWQNFLDVVTWISEKWDWMGDQLHKGWQWIDQNVFGPLKSGLDTVQEWFRKGVDGISRVWDGLRAAAARPVKFVIDTVWNNGILKAWNAIADFLPGIDTVNKIDLGQLGGYAQGGVLPGYTPGRDVHDFYSPTGGVIHLSGGEAIMRPEWTRAVGGPEAVERMNRAARLGMMDNPSGHGPAGLWGGFASGGVFNLGNFADGGVITTAVQRAMWDVVKKKYPSIYLTSATRSGGGMHGAGMATDWATPGAFGNSQQQLALAHDIAKTYPGSAELIYDSPGWSGNIKNGRNVGAFGQFYTMAQAGPHHNHVHWGMTTPPTMQFGGGVFEGGSNGGPGGPGGGGFFNWIADKAKGIWSDMVDPLKRRIEDMREDSKFWDIPFGFLETIKEKAWSFLSSKFGSGGGVNSGSVDISDVSGAVVEQVETVFARHGFTGAEWEAAKWIIGKESGWNPTATNPSSGAYGLFQFNPMGGNTLAAYLPDRNPDPAVQADAGARYIKDRYGSPTAAKAFWEQNGWYADGGVVDLAKLYDQGGWLPHGGVGVNLSGKPEPVFTAAQWSSLSDMIRTLGDLVPAIKGQTDVIAKAVDDAQAWLAKAGDYNSIEGINARQGARRVLDLGLDLPGSDIVKMVLDGEDTLWESRARAANNLDTIVEKEKALEEARKAVADLNDLPEGVSEDDKKKLDEAQKALDDAKAEKAKAESDDARAKAADKVTEAEKKLKEVREEVDKNSEENAKKHAEEVVKANEAVSKAEQELADARKKQAMDLDNVVLMSQGQIKGMIPQAKQLAGQLIGMGAPAQAVNAGLAQVTGQLLRLAGFAGPAGITLGMAMDMLKVGIGIIEAIKDLIDKIRKARLDAVKALADGWSVIADYAKLMIDLQGQVTSLQQALIRGANAQREAEYNLMLAQQDRYIAEAEGALKVAEARLALDAEIKRGAIIAQLKLMGLHEDWDSYMAYQALESQGVLQEWSDAAISALFTYEKARAEALKGELSARLEQIRAEAALAEAQRQNVRNQQDLLKAQERLIRMSAKVAGVDLVEATGTAQVAKLMAEMAEVKQAMDKNTLGRWGAALGAQGSHANEYRGQQAQYESLQQALDAVIAETGVQIDRGNLDRVLELMGRAAYRGGDPMAVLRSQLPELAQAETALKINEALKPVYDARDQRDDLARQVEDFTAEIDLYEKTTPLEQTLKGLDYTIASLEQSSQAWAEGNEELRGEYLAAAKANRDAAEAAGVDWKLDSKYANAGVRGQIRRETTIHLDGEKMYTADQIDQLLAEVTAGTNGSYRIVRSASEVAVARRKERV